MSLHVVSQDVLRSMFPTAPRAPRAHGIPKHHLASSFIGNKVEPIDISVIQANLLKLIIYRHYRQIRRIS